MFLSLKLFLFARTTQQVGEVKFLMPVFFTILGHKFNFGKLEERGKGVDSSMRKKGGD